MIEYQIPSDTNWTAKWAQLNQLSQCKEGKKRNEKKGKKKGKKNKKLRGCLKQKKDKLTHLDMRTNKFSHSKKIWPSKSIVLTIYPILVLEWWLPTSTIKLTTKVTIATPTVQIFKPLSILSLLNINFLIDLSRLNLLNPFSNKPEVDERLDEGCKPASKFISSEKVERHWKKEWTMWDPSRCGRGRRLKNASAKESDTRCLQV